MTKKTLISLIVALGLLAGTVWYIFYYPKNTPEKEGGGIFGIFGTSPFDGAREFGTTSPAEGIFGQFGEAGDFSRLLLRRISTEPVAGAGFATNEDGSTLIRYIERGTGHIYEMRPKEAAPQKISNITIPRIQEAQWAPSGNRLVLQYITGNGEVSSFVGEVQKENEDEPLAGFFLPPDTTRVTFSPTSDQLFYLRNSDAGSSGYSASALTGGSTREIFDSPLGGWEIEWPQASIITLTSAFHESAPGAHVRIHARTGTEEYLHGEYIALTARTNGSGEVALITRLTEGEMMSALYRAKTNTTEKLLFGTMAEKCVWGRSDQNILICAFPQLGISADDITQAYQGEFFFTDMLWNINIEEKTSTLLVDPEDLTNIAIDIIEPVISADDKNILFKNKRDQSLWLFTFLDEEEESEDERTQKDDNTEN
jgi:hypothetical protein